MTQKQSLWRQRLSYSSYAIAGAVCVWMISDGGYALLFVPIMRPRILTTRGSARVGIGKG